ncbi:MFS drug efflux transporter [Blastomyces dermatitidis ATCC 18188]|uniref:MFS drug efflux transporter n=1 Tax=Ajellomyces dermatitidis (strain ATCC 18188 / CBS 674.68) TaxID=653446 RepID=F2TSB5_AJEDA|nr:MFS drug efflux transporter [Blastomyces dermatitidis ATCC 18188]
MAVEKTEGDSSTSRAKDSTTEAESPTAIESPTLDTPPRNIDGWKWYLTFISILASTFLYALDVTVVADLQAVIVEELGGIQNLAWLSVAFLLCATAVNLVWGRMYGQVNVKWLFIVNAVIFEVGSAICGAAPSLNGMILGRALAVMGGPGLYVGCMTLIAATTTFTERPLSVSCTALTWGLGIVLGPVVGGAFSESDVGWRWAFYINIFIGAACAPFYLLLIPSIDPRPGATIKERWAELDDPGILLQGGALTAFILALNLGGLTFPWNSARIISMFVVAGVLFILLGIQQAWAIGTCPSRRIIPVQFFRSPAQLPLAHVPLCPFYMVPLFFQFTRGDTPLDAGWRLLPLVIVMIVFVFINRTLMAKLGYYMPWYLAGGFLTIVGSGLMYVVEHDTPLSRVYGYTVLIGTGVGMFLQASFSVTQAVVDQENFVGITIALALANAILLNASQDQIQEILPDVAGADIQAAILGARSGLVQNFSPDLKMRVLDAIVSAIDKTYALVIAGGALVAVSSLMIRREKLFSRPQVLLLVPERTRSIFLPKLVRRADHYEKS